jgi:type I restriction enzyme S subunit
MSGVLIVVISADGALQIPVSPLGGGGMISLSRVPLGELCEIVSGSTPKTADSTYWGGGIPWITPAELDGSHYVGKTERTLTEQGVQSAHLQMMPSGTVLLSSRAPIGKVAITTCGMACNQGFKNLVCGEKIDAEYLYWFLLSKARFLNSLGRGATFKELSRAIVSEVLIPLPSVAAQEEIASEFAGVEKIINQAREQKALLSGLVQSRFVEMFGATPQTVVPAGRVLVGMRNGVSPSSGGQLREKVLTLSAITQGQFDDDAWKDGTFSDVPPSDKRVSSSDFYICRGNGNIHLVGAGEYSATSRDDLVFPDTMIAARVDEAKVILPFLRSAWAQPFVREQIERRARTTNGTFKINQQIVASINIPLPPLSLQREFAEFTDRVDKSQFMQLSGIESTLQLKYLPDLRDRYSR